MTLGKPLMILALAHLLCAASASAFEYERFPDVPRVQVQTNTFVRDLDELCDSFAKRCIKAADAESAAICVSAPDATSERAALAELGRPETARSASAASLTYLANSVRSACTAIQSGQRLTAPQLDLIRALRDNPMLRDVTNEIAQGSTPAAALAEAANAGKPQGPAAQAALPGFDGIQGRLIQGVADFLGKRAKQEALAYLTKELQKDLCTGSGRQFYRATCASLDTLEPNRPLHAIRAVFKASVELDLRALPDVVLAYVLAQAKATRLVHETAFAGRVAFAYARALSDQRDPLDVARALGALPQQPCEKQKQCEEVGSGFRLTSAAFYAASQGGANWSQYFRSIDVTTAAGTGRAALVAFGLLVLAESRWVVTDPNARVFALGTINAFVAEPVKLWLGILELEQAWRAAVESAKPLSTQADRSASFTRTAELSFEKLSTFVEALLQRRGSPSGAGPALKAARQFLSAHARLMQREYAEGFAHLTLAVRAGVEGKALPNSWGRHLGFLVEVAAAESANEVAAALDTYAEPVGSYAEKYRHTHVALNGMVGAFGGGEFVSTRGIRGTSGAVGGFAPVGAHITTPIGRNGDENAFHLGLLLSVFDLGALTTYRFREELDDESGEGDARADQVPEVGFAQVVSPGAFLTLGVLGTPVVVGIGASVTPELRRVTASGAELEAGVLRYGLTVSMDVPVLFLL